jgi:uncharacterized protein (TIGR02597 family)
MYLPEHEPNRSHRHPAAKLALGAALLWTLLTGTHPANAAPSQAPAAASEPVGYLRTTLPAATNDASTRRTLGIPFSRPVVFSGTVSSVSATLQCSGAAWEASQFTTTPHYARLRTGTSAGLSFLITSHTASTLALDSEGESLGKLIANGDVFEIYPAHTLGSLFGTTAAAVPLRSGNSEAAADLVRLNNGSQWLTYFFDGSRWRTPGSDLSQDNTILPPGQGLFLVTKGLQPVSLALVGASRTRAERTTIASNGDTLLSLPVPLTIRLSELGLLSISSWKTGPAASLADTLRIWNGASWDILYHTGTTWEAAGSFPTPNPLLSATSAFLVHRSGDAGAPKETFPPKATLRPASTP